MKRGGVVEKINRGLWCRRRDLSVYLGLWGSISAQHYDYLKYIIIIFFKSARYRRLVEKTTGVGTILCLLCGCKMMRFWAIIHGVVNLALNLNIKDGI